MEAANLHPDTKVNQNDKLELIRIKNAMALGLHNVTYNVVGIQRYTGERFNITKA